MNPCEPVQLTYNTWSVCRGSNTDETTGYTDLFLYDPVYEYEEADGCFLCLGYFLFVRAGCEVAEPGAHDRSAS